MYYCKSQRFLGLEKYKIYNLIIASALPLPFHRYKGNKDVDVTILEGAVPEHIDNVITRGVLFELNEYSYLLKIAGLARFLVTNGSNIQIEFLGENDFHRTMLFLQGSVMGALLMQRGSVPIHANAILVKDKAVLFSGPSGAGKSTMAACFVNEGYDLIADDISVIQSDGNKSFVLPGNKRLKLWEDTIKQLQWDLTNYVKVREELKKFYVDVPKYGKTKYKIDTLFILSFSSYLKKPEIKELKGIEKFKVLRKNVYRYNYINKTERETEFLQQIASLASNIRVYRYERPESKIEPDTIVHGILEKL